MPIAGLPQRLDEISKELESLRTQSLCHPDKAAELLQDGLGKIRVSLKGLTTLVGGDMTEADRNAFVNDKLECEHKKSLARQEKLLDATRKVLAQNDMMGLLQIEADCARELIGAKYAATGHGYVNGIFTVGGVSCSEEAMDCPAGEIFKIEKGGVYLDMIKEKDSVRLTDAEMRSHPAWWGLPEGHVPLRGLLGARLVDVNDQPDGLLMVSDKEDGSDFTTEDENILSQLAAIVSLARQHIEARLEAENEKRHLEALMKALPVGVRFSDDPTCQSIKGNTAALAQFDVRPEDNLSASAPNGNAPGEQVRYFMDEQQITDAKLPLQRAVAENREIPPVELEVELPSGRRWSTEASGAPILDEQGDVIGGVAVTVDITERKLAEEARERLLKEVSEQRGRLQAILDSLPAAVFIADMDGKIVEANRGVHVVWGGSQQAPLPENVPGYEVYKGWWADTGEPLKPEEWALSRALRGEKVRVGDVVDIQRFDGTRGTVLSTAAPVLNQEGRMIGAVAVNQDITERKRAEVALQESDGKYRDLFENMSEIVTVDELLYDDGGNPYDWRILDVNPAYLRGSGRSRDGIIGRRLSEIYGIDRAPEPSLSRFAHVVETGEPVQFEQFFEPLQMHMLISATSLGGARFATIITDITDRKKAEEALRESEERLRSLIENVPCVLMRFDRQLRVVYLNQQSERYNPNTVEQMIGRTNREMGMPEHLCNLWDAAIERVFLTGNPEEMEFNLAGPSGMRTFELKFAPEFGPDHEVQYVLGVSSDITERKKAEEQLSQSQKTFSELVERAPFGIYIIDSQFRIAQMNIGSQNGAFRTVRPVIGRDLAEAIRIFWPEPVAADIIAAFRHTLETGEPYYSRGFRNPRHDVETVESYEWELHRMMLPDEQYGVICYYFDSTKLREAEEALQKQAELIDLSPDAIMVHQRDGIITFWSQGAQSLYGWTGQEAIGQRAQTLLQTHFAQPLRQILEQVQQTGYWSGELIQHTKDSRQVIVQSRWQAKFDNQGEVCEILESNVDITERKQAEEELHKAKDELELRIRERTAELVRTNGELLKAKDVAEAATKTKAEFLANMSHEIRTPMNSVIGFTELLLDDPDDPLSTEQRDNLESIRINGNALLTIINDILDFSKMESGKLVLEDQSFNLQSCVKESLDLVSVNASEKGLNLSYTVDKEVPNIIIGDLGRIRQVLGNLLSNAVKFTDKGGVKISVSIPSDGTDEVHFAVQDTGIGIPQSSMHQLFQPFNQMEPSTARLYGGTGLGLAISRKLVELMNGKIWAESEVGNGSTFHFTIKASSEQVEPKPATVSPQLIGKSILIVADNRINRRLLSKQVYEWGMIPIAARSGQEALSWIWRGDDFDIAILDMDLEDIEGLELEEKIQKHNKTLPQVLLISPGKHVPPNHAYLTKPIKPLQLHKVLTEILPETNVLSDRPRSRQTQSRQPLPNQPDKGLAKASGGDQLIQNKPLKILLAENNMSSQKVALLMLKKLGYKADVVANGIEALHALERQHYDMVLMDLKMPEMDGLEAARIIRQLWPDNGPKIIAITAYALEGDREKCLEAGMNDYIAKPVHKEDLAKVLEKYGEEAP